MKPREFDELVRQKFDQNEFAYNPGNWDRLEEQMDGRARKRSMLMWLWMPAVGMAASVALALGVTSFLKMSVPGAENSGSGYANTGKWVERPNAQQPVAMIPYTTHNIDVAPQKQVKKATRNNTKAIERTAVTTVGLKLQNVLHNNGASAVAVVVPNSAAPGKAIVPAAIKREVASREVYHTFRQDVHTVKKPLNLSVILIGGVFQGSRNSGYMAGATVRKMISDKVYVESDIAFASSDNTQSKTYMDYSGSPSSVGVGAGSGATAAKPASAEKTTTITGDDKVPVTPTPKGVQRISDVSYGLYYAQVTPSVGYKIMKRMSVAAGPDFQQMLVDNRPAASETDRGTIQVAPTFDVGFIGKTEYAVTQRVKAGVSYRKGINGVISMSDRYIDRDYIQFQMRCTIFNR